jgi:transcriptional regulator with XRE-family HTH domain
MRSLLSTVVAVVRNETGLSAEDFGKLIGKPVGTIRKLEADLLDLSEKTAMQINVATGVSLPWLLRGDASSPPVDKNGDPWNHDAFLRHRAGAVKARTTRSMHDKIAVNAANRLRDVLQSLSKNENAYSLALAKTAVFLEDLEKEFGYFDDGPSDWLYKM